jgi:hypothetical protein
MNIVSSSIARKAPSCEFDVHCVDAPQAKPLAGCERRRGHDVQIAGVRGEVMRRVFHFEKHGGLEAAHPADTHVDYWT